MNKSNALITDRAEKLLRLLVFLFPVFFLTIKGWTNSISSLFFLIAILYILRNPTFFFTDRGKVFWLFFITLLCPFFAELIVQIGRGEIVGRTLDGPSRFLAAAIFFVFMSRIRGDFSRCISAGSIFAVFVTSFSVLVFTDYYWDGRAATYFVDPITLPVYLVATLSLVQPTLLRWSSTWERIFSLSVWGLMLLLVGVVAVISQSRTSWIALIVLVETTLFLSTMKNKKVFAYLNFLLLICIFLSFLFVGAIQSRVVEAFDQIHMFSQGSIDTSVGLRLGLILMDLKLFLGFPLFGIADGQLPPLEWFGIHGVDVTPRLYQQKLLTGSHSEIFAQLTRKGIFGIPVLFFLFFVPIFYFSKLLMGESSRLRAEAAMGLQFSLVIFSSGLTIQVLNLKMTSTFFAFILAIMFASLTKNENDRVSLSQRFNL